MPLEFPSPDELPTVAEAFRRLLALPPGTRDTAVLSYARRRRLLSPAKLGASWDCDSVSIHRLIRSPRFRLPTDARALGVFLHGLGELAARGHQDTLRVVHDRLVRRRPRVDFVAVLSAAARADKTLMGPVTFESLALAQWIASGSLDWPSLHHAMFARDHPSRIFGHFGLLFVAKVVLTLAPRAVDRWLATRPASLAIAVVGRAAVELQLPWVRLPGSASLLGSRTPALQSLAAASLIAPIASDNAPLSLQACARTLRQHGLAPGDAVWMLGWRLKESVHARFRVEDVLRNAAPRLRHLRKHPDAAMGGGRNAPAEISMLERDIANAKLSQVRIEGAIESVMEGLAAIWPSLGLTSDQRLALEPVFVDTPEVRYRLAMKLADGDDRTALLRTNLGQLKSFLGLAPGLEPASDHFHRDESHFQKLNAWVAKSLWALHGSAQVGRRTGILLEPVHKAASAIIAKPFAAERWPTRWLAATGRAAFAHRFALTVVDSAPPGLESSVAKLNGMAVRHAFDLLAASVGQPENDLLFDNLAAHALTSLNRLEAPDVHRLEWAKAAGLPAFARALAIWSSPTLAESEGRLAGSLFKSVGRQPLSRGLSGRRWIAPNFCWTPP